MVVARLEHSSNLQKRLVVVLFPALLGPAQLLLFGPLVVFTTNQTEFLASFWDLAPRWIWLLVVVSGSLTACGVALPERLFTRYVALLFGVGGLLWVQGNLLVADYGLLYGEGLDLTTEAWRAPLDFGLWIGVIAVTVAFASGVMKVASLASALLMAMQAAVLVGPTVTDAALSRGEAASWRVPPDEVYQLSSTRNLFLVVLDGFQSQYFLDIIEEDRPSADRDFPGFVYFADHLGAFPTTRASMPAMFTGAAYRNDVPFEVHERQHEPLEIAQVLGAGGFRIRSLSFHRIDHPNLTLPGGENSVIYTIPTPYGSYRDYADFSAAQLLDLSLFRHVPHGLKSIVYGDQAWLVQRWYTRQRPLEQAALAARPVSNAAFLSEFARRATIGGTDPVYTFLHLAIPHPPIVTDAGCQYQEPTRTGPDNYMAQARCALVGVRELLDRLRELDIYDNSAVVLTSDHGLRVLRADGRMGNERTPAGNLDRIALSAMPLLAVKPPDSDGPLQTSDAPTMITDIPATILDLAGLPNVVGRGESVFAIEPEAPRQRTYVHHAWKNADWRRRYFDLLHLFSVNGPVTDPASWRFERAIFEPTRDLDAQLRSHEAGLFVVEDGPDGPFRWSTRQAVLYLRPDTPRFSFEVRKAPQVTPAQHVTVRIDGRVLDRHSLADDAWHRYEYDLAGDPTRADPYCVELLVTPHWRDSSNAAIGAMLRGDVLAR